MGVSLSGDNICYMDDLHVLLRDLVAEIEIALKGNSVTSLHRIRTSNAFVSARKAVER